MPDWFDTKGRDRRLQGLSLYYFHVPSEGGLRSVKSKASAEKELVRRCANESNAAQYESKPRCADSCADTEGIKSASGPDRAPGGARAVPPATGQSNSHKASPSDVKFEQHLARFLDEHGPEAMTTLEQRLRAHGYTPTTETWTEEQLATWRQLCVEADFEQENMLADPADVLKLLDDLGDLFDRFGEMADREYGRRCEQAGLPEAYATAVDDPDAPVQPNPTLTRGSLLMMQKRPTEVVIWRPPTLKRRRVLGSPKGNLRGPRPKPLRK
jgi:hypothetical protein